MSKIIIIAVIVILILWFISTYNSMSKLRLRVQEAFADMDVFLKKRYDLIPNIVETVKGYAKHESETLEKVISARSKALTGSAPVEKLANEKELSSCMSRLLMLTENYPELKADTQFIKLQNQLNAIENDIAQSRKYYNGIVRTYNSKISLIPGNIIAGICGFKSEPFFSVDDESERKNVKVQF